MPAAYTTLLFALDDTKSYCSSPPGFNIDDDREQTEAGHLRSSVVSLAANGLPLLEHVPVDEIKARKGTILILRWRTDSVMGRPLRVSASKAVQSDSQPKIEVDVCAS